MVLNYILVGCPCLFDGDLMDEVFKFCVLSIQASHAVLAINPENVEMSRFYASTMKEIALKLVYKL